VATNTSEETTAVYVYGVVRSGTLRKIKAEGVGGAAVELLESGGLTALVSPVADEELRVKRQDLNRHLAVLEEAFATTTILPCPFATVIASNADLVQNLLVAGRDDLLSAIHELDGKVQLNVKAVYDEEQVLREIVATNAEVTRLRESTRRLGQAGYYSQLELGELVARAVADRKMQDEARLAGELETAAFDLLIEEDQAAAFKASFLVPRKELKKFDRLLQEIAKREQPFLQFEVIGPLPPTAFAAAYAGV
jgi:Gas vesicle synthesis protein GvpL/GvpF